MTGDPRGSRVAVVADTLLLEALPGLVAKGYGVIQLPPPDLDPAVAGEWLEQVAEQVAEYCRTGYEVVAVSDDAWAVELEAALTNAGVDALPPLAA